jgi:hypothetical protein
VRFLAALSLAVLAVAASAAPVVARGGGHSGGYVPVRGYVTSRGTYVAPHVRTRPDGIVENNLSYRRSQYRPVERAPVVAGMPPDGPISSSEGPCVIPGPTTWTTGGEPPRDSWCDPKRLVGTGAGFCMIN